MLHRQLCTVQREEKICFGQVTVLNICRTLFTVSPSTHFKNSSLAQHLVSFRRHSGWFFEVSRVFQKQNSFDFQGSITVPCLKVDVSKHFLSAAAAQLEIMFFSLLTVLQSHVKSFQKVPCADPRVQLTQPSRMNLVSWCWGCQKSRVYH